MGVVGINTYWEMLTNALRVIVNNSFTKIYIYIYIYIMKKKNNVLTTFFISHKSGEKTFLQWIINHCPKGTH